MTAAARAFREPPASESATRLVSLNARLAALGAEEGSGIPGQVRDDDIGWGAAPEWAIGALGDRLGLNDFERDIVMLAAAAELYAPTQALLARLGGGVPTLGLALRLAGDEGDWRALRSDGALRRARVLALGDPEGRLTERPLRLEEPALLFLQGIVQLDERLSALALPQGGGAAREAEAFPEALAALATALDGRRVLAGLAPTAEIASEEFPAGIAVACAALARAGFGAVTVPLSLLPQDADSLASLRSAWLRDALLHDLGLVFVDDGTLTPAPGVLAGWAAPLLLVTTRAGGAGLAPMLRVTLDILDPAHQTRLWAEAVGAKAARSQRAMAARIAGQFRLPAGQISALGNAGLKPPALWAAARAAARPAGNAWLEPIEPRARLDDVILPAPTRALLDAMVMAVRMRTRIEADWGFAAQSTRGLGIAALFSGESGTGKTMAAEAIANALEVDLYRVEVSAVVSKYIGETEKNLRSVFAAATRAGGVLLFDEADSLFGKRSEVRDSHDRYANMEVGYLLQQMESYRGLAILTSNMAQSIDPAFMRRLRFVARFPLPGAAERQRIWEGVFPADADCLGIDHARLARLAIPGGVIRNIALGAAYRAAGAGCPIGMVQVLDAARAEFAKLERPASEIDSRDWARDCT